MAELRLSGRPASPGFAQGLPFRLPERVAGASRVGNREEEVQALRKAIDDSVRRLNDMVAGLDADAAELIGFQIAMLEDDALAEPAFAAIDTGISAYDAWLEAIEAEIAHYRSADDEYFRARSADLEDMRDLVLDLLSGSDAVQIPESAIVLARDFQPSRFLSVDWSKGGAILLSEGSPTSHVAMLARTRGVPMIVGLGDLPQTDSLILVDGVRGEVVIGPNDDTHQSHLAKQNAHHAEAEIALTMTHRSAKTADGQPVCVYINIADPAELAELDPSCCDGIGLVRTEFLFGSGPSLPDEETQYGIYRRIVEWAQDRPATIRTLDAGGDKPISGLTIDHESNPFLGTRGIRLSFARSDVFRVQLRALARAAVHGSLKVMVPMVTTPKEFDRFKSMMDEEIAMLHARGTSAKRPALGMMVEVPAAAIAIDCFDADFFSIGSNDLTQYVTAAGRDNGDVADLADPLHPAMLRLFAAIAAHGRKAGREVSLCGDAAGDPHLTAALLGAGLRVLSVAPTLVGKTKLAISRIDVGRLESAS